MGCGCYEGRTVNELGMKHRRGKNNPNSSLNKNNGFNMNNTNEPFDKISSINSSILVNSNIDLKKIGKINTLKDTKYSNNNKNIPNYGDNLNSHEQIICNISWINFNNNEKQKFQIKISKSGSIQDLINLIQIEINRLYKIKQHVFLYYKGIKMHEDETLYNLLHNQNEFIEFTDGNENIRDNQKEIKEIDFEVILIPYEDEEDIINEKMASNISNGKKEKNEIENLKEYKLTKKIIKCLFPKCNIHKDEALSYICLTCTNSFCARDFEKHQLNFKDHNIIDKNKLLDLNFEVRNIKKEMVNKYDELVLDMNIGKNSKKDNFKKNQINYISTNDLFIDIKMEINKITEKLETMFNLLRESYQKVNMKFLSIYEVKMPQIIEFSEYVDKTLSSGENLNIFSNENMFIENYDSCISIKKISDKYFNNIIYLKELINKYKEFLESSKKKGNNLLDYIKKGIDNIMKVKNIEKKFNASNKDIYQVNENEDNFNKNSKKILNDVSLNTTKDLNQSINLKFLFSDKKASKKYDLFKKDSANIMFSKFKNRTYKDKEKISNNFDKKPLKLISEQIIFDKNQNIPSSNVSLNSENNQSNKLGSNISSLKEPKNLINIYSLIYGTSNLIKYNIKLKKLEIISPDISNLKITKFETYISKLNFKNKFYLSGGYTTSKSFFEYDDNTNKFIKLPEMISNHYYHNMIGYKNYIFSVSGFKSKKVEKYDLMENKWIPLPDLEYERTFPNCLIYNDSLFIFGKINNLKEDLNNNFNIIEHIKISDEISNGDNNWIQIKLNFNFPFNSGILKINSSFILVGGKLDINEDCIRSSYIMQINEINNKYNINIELNDNKLEKPDEFAGNNFCEFDEKEENFGIFSIVNPYLFYIFDKNSNKFSTLLYEEKKDDI